jgi:phage shock protein PspC (stress-responsive transcriptional regulator)
MTTAPPPTPPPSLPPSAEPPPWQPPPAPVRPQLRRSRTDKVAGGVAGGLAEYSGIDALLWRVGFVALTLAGGTGLIVYLLLWLLMPVGAPAPYDPAAYPSAPATRRVKPPAGPRSPVPGVTIAALLIAVGLIALVDNVFGWDVGPTAYFGSALLVIGLGLVAAAFVGGRSARGGLIALGIVLSLATVTSASEPWQYGGENGIGDQTFREIDGDFVEPAYHCGVGDCTLDLSGIDDFDELITTRLDAGVGDVEVILPESADVRVTVDSGLGGVRVFGQNDTRGFFPGEGSRSWTDDGEPEFDVTINAGIGDVEVSRG